MNKKALQNLKKAETEYKRANRAFKTRFHKTACVHLNRSVAYSLKATLDVLEQPYQKPNDMRVLFSNLENSGVQIPPQIRQDVITFNTFYKQTQIPSNHPDNSHVINLQILATNISKWLHDRFHPNLTP